jgi:hypothetical protein
MSLGPRNFGLASIAAAILEETPDRAADVGV